MWNSREGSSDWQYTINGHSLRRWNMVQPLPHWAMKNRQAINHQEVSLSGRTWASKCANRGMEDLKQRLANIGHDFQAAPLPGEMAISGFLLGVPAVHWVVARVNGHVRISLLACVRMNLQLTWLVVWLAFLTCSSVFGMVDQLIFWDGFNH